MSDDLLISQCSPTLAGIKTANMFSAEYKSREEIRCHLRRLNAKFAPKGMRILPLRYMDRRVLLYLYRPAELSRDLENEQAQDILRSCGYDCDRADKCLCRLIRRLRENEDFPHEVGLFLGYPPEDVKGFIENRAGGSKLTGSWKVYGDVEAAKRKFESYDRCTQRNRGRSLDEILSKWDTH